MTSAADAKAITPAGPLQFKLIPSMRASEES